MLDGTGHIMLSTAKKSSIRKFFILSDHHTSLSAGETDSFCEGSAKKDGSSSITPTASPIILSISQQDFRTG